MWSSSSQEQDLKRLVYSEPGNIPFENDLKIENGANNHQFNARYLRMKSKPQSAIDDIIW
jgi:hypothetical protein